MLVVGVILITVVVLILWHLENVRAHNELTAASHRYEALAQRTITELQRTFTKAVEVTSDATAKAVQSITYPEVTQPATGNGRVATENLLPPRDMGGLERDVTLDYSDPTDATIPDAVLRPDTAMLGDDLNSPMGIPGFKVDPQRYGGAGT